jgi:RNA polymerase sigma-70 factor (ECF subfamily)
MDTGLEAAATPGTRSDALDWDTVYRALLPKVYRFFCYQVGEGQLAEDLTSTTFEKAWRRRRRYRRDLSAFSTWVFTIARNVAIDHFRTAKQNLPLEPSLIVNESAPSPEAEATTQEQFARLATLVAHLSDRERQLLALRYGAALSYAEIAEISGLTSSNVGVILHRAVKRLRQAWEETDER